MNQVEEGSKNISLVMLEVCRLTRLIMNTRERLNKPVIEGCDEVFHLPNFTSISDLGVETEPYLAGTNPFVLLLTSVNAEINV
jgi:hypothetical protein